MYSFHPFPYHDLADIVFFQNRELHGIRPLYARGHISESTMKSLKRKGSFFDHNFLPKKLTESLSRFAAQAPRESRCKN